MFYHIFWVKSIENTSYEMLVKRILKYRKLSTDTKYAMCIQSLSVQDSLANALHETHYLFGQLESAGIITIQKGYKVGNLRQGGFGRGYVPEFLSDTELAKHKPTGIRAYRTDCIELTDTVYTLINKLLNTYPFDEKPHSMSDILGRQDYILHLYNFYPQELLVELNINNQERIQTMLQISKDIVKLSRNQQQGDCYRFEKILADAFNEFNDVTAEVIGGAGNADIECMYLAIDEKFDIEAKSTQTKLSGINSGRLRLHRQKIGSKYTIVVAPYYMPSVESDIANNEIVMITASSLSNFLYQYTVHSKEGISYAPLYHIIQNSFGTNITQKVNDYVGTHFGIGRS